MALLLTYFCSTSSRKKTVSFLSCLMPRVYPAHKPLQANISARKMALDVYETHEGTCACTCCRRTTRTSTRRGYHRPPARASREVGLPRSTARIRRRATRSYVFCSRENSKSVAATGRHRRYPWFRAIVAVSAIEPSSRGPFFFDAAGLRMTRALGRLSVRGC